MKAYTSSRNAANVDNREIIRALMGASNGQFIGVTFIKKNGELRNLNGRLGVNIDNKHTSANQHTDYLNIYDVKNHGWKRINLNTVQSVRMNHIEYALK